MAGPDARAIPTNNAAVFGFCELVSLMLALPAGDAFYKGDPISIRMAVFAGLGLLSAIIGPMWPRFKGTMPRRFSVTFVRVASDFRWWMVVLLFGLIVPSSMDFLRERSLGVKPGQILAVAWTRRLTEQTEELIFVSDSRYRGGDQNFDACPKILTLPRSDCAICFAGDTQHALPMMLQLSEAIGSYDQARRRSQDITPLKSHILKVFDSMAENIVKSSGVPNARDPIPKANFLFGGYSWTKKTFEIWEIFYNESQRCFEERPCGWLNYLASDKRYQLQSKKGRQSLGRFAAIGDQRSPAYLSLIERLGSVDGIVQHLDWEPFEVVRDMLRDVRHSETIGGAPQVLKVYQYMRADPLAVFWPRKQGGYANLKGRKCLGYERLGRRILDPDTLRTEPWIVPPKIAKKSILADDECQE
jgi:hypothetical protein